MPKLFKSALIHPIYKGNGKDPRSPGSYRPIAILPALSKILETVLRDSLLQWLELKGLLPDSQSGFRPNRSVALALTCAQTDWMAAKSRGEAIAIMAYDYHGHWDKKTGHVAPMYNHPAGSHNFNAVIFNNT